MTNTSFQRSLACLALTLMVEIASAQLSAPSAGVVRQRDGALRRLDGVAGSFTLGPVVSAEPAIASAFDANGGLIQLDGVISVVDTQGRESARFDTPSSGRAIVSGKLAYFAADRSLWSYSNVPRALPLMAFEGTVIAIGSTPDGVSLAVRRDNGVWRLRIAEDGSVSSQDPLPGTGSALLLLSAGVLYADGSDVVYVDGTTRAEKSWTISGVITGLAAMAGGSVQILSDGGSYVIRLDRDRAYMIPESGPPGSKEDSPGEVR